MAIAKNKNGQIDVQFHWIFIILIGAIILSFFVGLSVWYKNTQEQKNTANIVVALDSVLDTAKESPKTARTTTIPDITLSFTCSSDECNDYGCASAFSGGGISHGTETEILFSLKELSGNDLITWALEWKLPYTISNFLYVTTDNVRYIFVYDEEHKELAYAVTSLLAENDYLTKETIKIEEPSDFAIIDKNDNFVRIVAFLDSDSLSETTVETALGENSANNKKWDIIYVDGSEESGTIYFSEESVSVSYAGLPLLLGAIFSADRDFYMCNVKKAALQGKVVSAVYLERTKALYDAVSAVPEKSYCSYYYGQDVQEAITTIMENVDILLSNSIAFSSAVQELMDNNNYAVIKNCPRVY